MMIRDLRLALRTLLKSPGFLTLAMLTLALGVGAAAVLFSVTESVIWKPLSFADSERLVRVYELNLKRPADRGSVSAPNFRDWRDRLHTLDGLAAMSWGESYNLTGRGISERVSTKAVSAGFFETLGVQPALGRTFGREEEQAGTNRVVILSYDFWRRAFDGAPAVLGQSLKVDGQPYTVAGVMPGGFHLEVVSDPDVFLPLEVAGAAQRRDNRALLVIGRTRTDVTLQQVTAELQSVAGQLAAEYPQANANRGAGAENLRESFTSFYRHNLFLYLGFAGLVLLIACANVAGLMLVRFVARQKEFALRTALGASRASLLRQTLAETAWIAIPGGALGATLAAWGIAGIRAVMPAGEFLRSAQISMDLRTLGFVLAVSLASAFGFALAPVATASKMNLDAVLRDWGKSVAGSPRARRRIDLLIAAEVSLAFLLLFAAGLFLSSHFQLRQVALGFDPRNVLTVRIAPGGETLARPERLPAFYGEVLRRAEAAPSAGRASMASALPLTGTSSVYFSPADHPRPARGEEPFSLTRVVSPEYFGVMRIPLLQGRAFTDRDSSSSPRVAIVNQNLARRIFGTASPVGKELAILPGGNPTIPVGTVQVVGLAANVKEAGLDEVVFNDIYFPFAQNPQRSMTLAVKTTAKTEAVVPALRHGLQTLDADAALYGVATMEQRIEDSLGGERFNLLLVSVFAGLAVLLAGVGVYGAIAFSVAQRTREFGLRVALGAMPRAILRLTLQRTVRLTLAGAACGLGLALILGTLLRKALYLAPGEHGGMLYGVNVHDPASLGAAAAIMLGLAALAGMSPALRAAKVDPLTALRHD